MQPIEIIKELRSFPLASCLSNEELASISEQGEIRNFNKHELVFCAGEKSDEIFFLIKGVVKITSNANDGREVIKMILHPQAILSEQSLCGEDFRVNDAIILTSDAIVLALNVSFVKEMMRNNPDLVTCVINFIGKKLKYTEERLESLALSDARERIVQFLKVNAASFGRPIGFETLLKHDFTQQDIANFTGTSRQTVTTVLNDLKKTNKIHFKRKAILIRDISSLV